MAFVDGPISISFNFQDDDLAEASTSVKLPVGTTLAAAKTFAASYVSLLGPVTDCALTAYNITQEVYDDTYPVAALGSDVENKGVLTIRTANNGTSTLSWPGVLESILVNSITPAGTYIDLLNVSVAALVTALVSGLAGTQPSDRRGADFRSVKEAYKQNRGSQKSRQYKG
ncbi:MAG: hypothetical protein WCJ55_15365 [Chloroflexales bacterium]